MVSFTAQTLKSILYRFCYVLRNIVDPLCNFQEVSILAYHSLSNEHLDTAVTVEAFERQLQLLKSKGFSFVSVKEIVDWFDGGMKKNNLLPRKCVAITFDDGYADFETVALPILERYSAPATLFLIGDGSGDEQEIHKNLQNNIPLLSQEARDRVARNSLVEIGYHSRTHGNLGELIGKELEDEIAPPARMQRCRFFAYPGGRYSEEALNAVRDVGYAAGFCIKRRLVCKETNRYLFPRTVVTHTMQPWLVAVHATQAIEWYRLLTRLFK